MNNTSISYRAAALLSLSVALIVHLNRLVGLLTGNMEYFMYEMSEVVPVPLVPGIIQYVLISLIVFLFVLNFLQFILNFRLLNLEISNAKKIALILFASITLTIALSLLYFYILTTSMQIGFDWQAVRMIIVRNIVVTLIIVISSYLIYLYKNKRQMEMEYERLQAESIQSKYEALKNQIDPHFLFNSLNTLNSLIDISPEKSKDFVRKLSQVFRHALQNKEVATLKEELEFTQSYCSLMQIRYGEALTFIFDIAPEALNRSIVPLSLQVLIENAVKHNIINRKQPLTVTVSTSDDNNYIMVSNPVQRTKIEEKGEGIGLPNLSERYRLKWHKNIVIRELNNEFSVTIPLIDDESNNH